MRLHRILTLSFVSLSLVALLGCSTTTTTAPTVNTFPGVGSTFTVQDSTSVFISVVTGDYQVTEVNGNIMTVLNPPGINHDTTRQWYQFASNGNVWMDPKPSGSHSDWFIMPFGSQNPVNTSDPGIGANGPYTTQISAIGEGSGTFTVNSQSYDTKKVKLTITTSDSTGSSSIVSHWAYAPAIGYIVSYDEEDRMVQGTVQSSEHRKLISFVKK